MLILGGPTASGKSYLANVIAKKYDGVIINADAMQVYREIPIITAQPTKEEQATIPHALYGVLSVHETCSATKWLAMAKDAIDTAHRAGKLPIVVGGTGLYLKTLMEGLSPIPDIAPEIRKHVRQQCRDMGNVAFHALLMSQDPIMAERLPVGDTQRIIRAMEVIEQTGKSLAEWQALPPTPLYSPDCFHTLFIHPEREILYRNCNARFISMTEQGALDEIEVLDALALDTGLPAMKALGVPELLSFLHGEYSQEEAITKAQQSTRHYAKRQVTWFRHQLKGATEIVFSTVDEAEEKLQFLLTHTQILPNLNSQS